MAPGHMKASRSRAARAFSVLGPLALAASCSQDSITVPDIVHPTLVEVSPTDFLGSVACIDATGAMRSYVATFFDLGVEDDATDGGAGAPGDAASGAGGQGGDGGESGAPAGALGTARGTPIANTGPASCTTAIGYGKVTPGHRYRAEILGFDRDGLELSTTDSPVATPEVIDAVTRKPVAARWRASCGPATSREAVIRQLGNCSPLTGSDPDALGEVFVSLDAARGSLACGSRPGEIEHYEVTGPSGTVSAACDDEVRFMGVTPGRTLVLAVAAFEAGNSTPAWGTTCLAEPPPGVPIMASCQSLTDRGALEVDPAAASAALGVSCTELGALDLSLEGGPTQSVRPGSCGALVAFGGLERGEQNVLAKPFPAPTSGATTARCSGSVIPGQRVLASCRAEP